MMALEKNISGKYVRDLKILTDKVMEFEKSLVLICDLDKDGSYYEASYVSATLAFYYPIGGFLRYALARRSILDRTYIVTKFFTVKNGDGFYQII